MSMFILVGCGWQSWVYVISHVQYPPNMLSEWVIEGGREWFCLVWKTVILKTWVTILHPSVHFQASTSDRWLAVQMIHHPNSSDSMSRVQSPACGKQVIISAATVNKVMEWDHQTGSKDSLLVWWAECNSFFFISAFPWDSVPWASTEWHNWRRHSSDGG